MRFSSPASKKNAAPGSLSGWLTTISKCCEGVDHLHRYSGGFTECRSTSATGVVKSSCQGFPSGVPSSALNSAGTPTWNTVENGNGSSLTNSTDDDPSQRHLPLISGSRRICAAGSCCASVSSATTGSLNVSVGC